MKCYRVILVCCLAILPGRLTAHPSRKEKTAESVQPEIQITETKVNPPIRDPTIVEPQKATHSHSTKGETRTEIKKKVLDDTMGQISKNGFLNKFCEEFIEIILEAFWDDWFESDDEPETPPEVPPAVQPAPEVPPVVQPPETKPSPGEKPEEATPDQPAVPPAQPAEEQPAPAPAEQSEPSGTPDGQTVPEGKLIQPKEEQQSPDQTNEKTDAAIPEIKPLHQTDSSLLRLLMAHITAGMAFDAHDLSGTISGPLSFNTTR